ncbi:ATP-binding protein [Streptomyces albipurpureus]|uniref:histidine kinase n=1 Tax=Streptomyces albipurpureus TaxID=2897419 RepID=A0ABT0UXY8_9ACTN|nr:ATP-binding protein [Streptomyces sp. CWNU-1]MCM2392021.1 ATP-binding protein [Streptomyces sp. CWNU-1]
MRADVVVVVTGCGLGLCLAVALVYRSRWKSRLWREQARAREERDALGRALEARDRALEYMVTTGLAELAASMRLPEPTVSDLPFPAVLRGTRFLAGIEALSELWVCELERARVDSAEQTTQGLNETSREASRAAVRSFSSSITALGAHMSRVVDDCLREHQGDAVFASLTRIDHTAQQMSRQAQSFLVMCGGLPGRSWPATSVTDVVRGAMGRVRDFPRVRFGELDVAVQGRFVEPLVHVVANLLDNALRYSPPTATVEVSVQQGHHGVTVLVDDAGIQMTAEDLALARAVLSGAAVDLHALGPHPKAGFPSIAALAHRYGFQVALHTPSPFGGTRASVFITRELLHAAVFDQAAPVPTPAAAPVREPEGVAEGDAVLPRRRRRAAVSAPDPSLGLVPGPAHSRAAAAWVAGSRSGREAAQSTHPSPEGTS